MTTGYDIAELAVRANEVNALIFQLGQAGDDYYKYWTRTGSTPKPGWWFVNLRVRRAPKGNRYPMKYATGWGPTPAEALESAITEWLTPRVYSTPKLTAASGEELLSALGLD